MSIKLLSTSLTPGASPIQAMDTQHAFFAETQIFRVVRLGLAFRVNFIFRVSFRVGQFQGSFTFLFFSMLCVPCLYRFRLSFPGHYGKKRD